MVMTLNALVLEMFPSYAISEQQYSEMGRNLMSAHDVTQENKNFHEFMMKTIFFISQKKKFRKDIWES